MAATLVKIGQKVTSVGTSEVEIQIDETAFNILSPTAVACIELDSTNSGTIQFSVGETVGANQQPYAASAKVLLPFKNGVLNIRYKASGASQSFSISAVNELR